jgi:phenylacetic acid degradation operon negative regulatory protein
MNAQPSRSGRQRASAPDAVVRRWIERRLAAEPPRASSLTVTVWGDAIAPHGGAVMLSGLIRLLAPLGMNERLVRTSVFRLAREGWLAAKPIGRRSLYRLTRTGGRRFEQAYRRIYAAGEPAWDGDWELVIGDGLTTAQRRKLRDELTWEGFGVLAPAIYARPSRRESRVARIARDLRIERGLLTLRAREHDAIGGHSLAAAALRAWPLGDLARDYRSFLKSFGAVIERFRGAPTPEHDPEQCFVVRTLLIHDYRRLLLRDPQLPTALLPLDWPGSAAGALCRDFYGLTHRAAERHLLATLEGPQGALPPAEASFYARFGGLPR